MDEERFQNDSCNGQGEGAKVERLMRVYREEISTEIEDKGLEEYRNI